MSSSSKSGEFEFPGARPASVDLDGELQLAKLRRVFAGAQEIPVRYRQWEVERLLGSGGMGRVYLARHVALDRRVAIKLVSPTEGGDGEARALRMIREAQALARVQHPNVLAIHQVDTSGERTVIEMEYVEGSTLRSWQSAPGRSWRAIVKAYAAAGDGLAAIHEAGLLHRDIKPDNLLVDSADRVKVADLGLAIAMDREDTGGDGDGDVDQDLQHGVLGLPLTAGGGLVGTHGYMAPEVIAGDEASAASDQFSLAVSLYEAIFGTLPFVGDSPRELARAMHDKALAESRVRSWRPWWLRRCLARALNFEPSQRYPSVADFVARLRFGLALRRRFFAGGLTLALSTAVATAGWLAKPSPADPCAAVSEEIAAVWGPERRQTVLAGLADDGSDPALALLVSTLDERVAVWRTARTQLCGSERAQQHTPNSVQAQLDAQQGACLRYTKNHLEALVDALATGSGNTIRYADLAEAVDSLPSCTQRLQLGHWAQVMRDDETDLRLSEALAAEVNGEYEHAIALARAIVGETKGRDPFRQVQALYRLGRVLGLARQDAEALEVLEQARNAAFVLGHDELICRASAFEAKLNAGIRHDPAVARRELEFAEACAQRVGARSLLLRAELLEVRGLLAQAADAPDQAAGWHQQALELRLEQLGPEHPVIAKSKLNLANALSAAGPASVDEATQIRRLYVEALELREASFGPEHPEIAHVLFDLGDFDRLRGALELARGSLERAEQIYAKTDGGHPRARLKLHLALAQMALSESQLAEARAEIERAASVKTGELDARLEHATLRFLAGMLALYEGDFRRAAQALRQARILHERLDPSGSVTLSCMAFEIEASHGLEDRARVVALVLDGGPELRAHLETFGPEVCGAIAWYAAEALMHEGEFELARIYFELARRCYVELGDAENSKQLEQLLTTLDTQQGHDHDDLPR